MNDLVEDLIVRPFRVDDESDVIELWRRCGLITPQNDPHQDIELKIRFQAELFLVAEIKGCLVGTVMAGYEGHRGWINYLGVLPELRRQGLARRLMAAAEDRLRELGCPKINLQVRTGNKEVLAFYQRLGFVEDRVVSLGKRL